VDRTALWKALRSSGVPPFLIQLIEHLHTGTTSRVRVGGQLSEPFETTSGVCQGCVLAPALFYIAIDWILSSCAGTMGTTVGFSKFTDQDYADDAMLFSDIHPVDEAAHTMGLNTSCSKTKIQNLGHVVTPAAVQKQGHSVESTDRFTYPGSDIHSSELSTRDTQAYRSSFKYFRQTHQCLEVDRIEFNDEGTSLQCPCHLRTVIWLGDMDSPEG